MSPSAAPVHSTHRQGRSADEPWSDDLAFLLGDDVDGLLADYIERTSRRFVSARPSQVAHTPGRSTTVRYRVEVADGDAATRTETFVVSLGGPPVPGATMLRNGDAVASLWNWRDDPALPGLRAALDTARVSDLFADLGIARSGGKLDLRVRAYRPGRRAVVEARDGRRRLFLKVVRPDRVERLHRTHRRLAETMPVPDSIGWTDSGVMVLPPVSGETLRDALRRGERRLPTPDAIDQLVARLPAGVGRQRPRAGWIDEARRHAGVIEATVPGVRDGVRLTLERLDALDVALAADGDDHESVTVHGDLYEAQVMVDGDRIVGLLDVDTVGVGHRIDDLANFCAHLSVLATVWPSARDVNRYGSELLAAAERRHGRRPVRARVAAATLGLATGPFRTLEANWEQNTARRIELAERWLDGAERRTTG